MTPVEVRRAIKANAFKKIRRLVRSSFMQYECAPDENAAAGRYYQIRSIINDMNKKLFESRVKERTAKEIGA